MGRVDRGVPCSVTGCTEKAVRSISGSRTEKHLQIQSGTRRAYLCQTHYKELKKKSRNERKVEQWRYSE